MTAPAKLDVPCNACGSRHLIQLYADELGDDLPPVDYQFSVDTRRTFRIVRCADCGLVFTHPMPDLGKLYADTIDHVYVDSSSQRRKAAEFAVKVLARHKPAGRLLDVGCNIGLFLDAAADRYTTEGIELSAWAAGIAGKRHRVIQQTLSSLKLDQQYDLITLWGVIEHFDNPRIELEAIKSALVPGGIAAFYTGDLDAWLPRLLGKKWWWYQGMHLFYFSRKTLTRMLADAGLEVVEYRTHRLYFQLFSLANSLNRYAIGPLLSPILNLPVFRDLMLPVQISGEMLLIARRPL